MNPANNDIRLLLVVGIAAMLMLFISVLLSFIFTQRKKLQFQQSLHALQQAQQYHLVEAAVRSEETERHRIAEKLHDEVGALLSSSKLHFKMMILKNADSQSRTLFDKGNELLDDAITEIRGISHNLHSYILQEFGLNEAIKHFSEKIADSPLIKITTKLDDHYKTTVPQNDIALYRITQELLNNILKHAEANIIHISSVYKNSVLNLTLVYNGQGLTQEMFEELCYTNEGLGLKNIQSRIYLLKGSISFFKVNNDYHIKISVPTLITT